MAEPQRNRSVRKSLPEHCVFRYQYLETNGVQWRLDRLTQQMCQVTIGEARCKISLSSAVSTSVSTSITTSTSVSVKKSKSH